MIGLLHDVRYALRGLRRTPSFTLFAILTLALGIGGTAVMFAVAYGVLLRPLPFPDQDRLVGLWEVHPGANAPLKNDLLSRPTYRTWTQQSTTLDAIGAYTTRDHILGTVLRDELADCMVVRPLTAGRCEDVQHCRLGVFEVGQSDDALAASSCEISFSASVTPSLTVVDAFTESSSLRR